MLCIQLPLIFGTRIPHTGFPCSKVFKKLKLQSSTNIKGFWNKWIDLKNYIFKALSNLKDRIYNSKTM